jgi:IS605 OrfB family transposase
LAQAAVVTALRGMAAPFVADPATGVCIRTRLKGLTDQDEAVLGQVGAVEDLDFTDSKTREKHGHRRRFRQIISGMPTAQLRARLISMATQHAISVIAVDPAYTY